MLDRRYARRKLDERIARIDATAAAMPHSGWVRAIRDALGMTSRQLASRMGVAQPTLSGLERAEANRTVTLASLDRAAEALGCRVVHALVPDRPLDDMVSERARQVAARQLDDVAHSMSLEGQAEGIDADDLTEELAGELVDRRGLWEDDAHHAAGP